MDLSYYPKCPNIGDIIGCSDGDVGIVLRVYPGSYEDRLMVEILWSAGETLTDPWRAQDYMTENDMFHIMSRA